MNQDMIDAMRYCYNDIITTMKYAEMFDNKKIGIKHVVFNDPATIILWTDGTKTIVKCSNDDVYDPEKGLAMAICKKVLGNNFKQCFKKWTPEEQD